MRSCAIVGPARDEARRARAEVVATVTHEKPVGLGIIGPRATSEHPLKPKQPVSRSPARRSTERSPSTACMRG
jgi:hypothetical protein